VIELRRERPQDPAGHALFGEYMALVRERLGPAFEPSEDIFASEDDFSAFLVAYDGGVPVACGGLCPRAAGDGEIKRMFVTAAARRRGHARRLLAELEAIARESGLRRILLYTTEVLDEARRFYATAGYAPLATRDEGTRVDFWLEKRLSG
jgi:GNAT superfamily N-acetyltransferase